MIRLLSILIGLGFTVVVMWAFLVGAYTAATEGLGEETVEYAFHEESHAPDGGFTFSGPLGKFDNQQLQRGFQVYQQVCSSCHGLKFVAIRDLEQLGYNGAELKAIAAAMQVPGINPDTGEISLVSGKPTDYFPSPYESTLQAALANNNAVPPDLSLITKARPNGSAYIYSLLTGYRDEVPTEITAAYPDFEKPEGLYFNQYFPNLNIAMAPPLTMDGQITYGEGNPEATKEQMAVDVAAFLTWTAEPSMVKRKQTGWWVVLFLIFATVLAYLSKKQIWSNAKPKKRED